MAARTSAARESAQDFVLARTYEAPRALVFRMWTEPEHLKQWWAPDGCSTHYCTVDLRPGGKFHVCVRTPGNDFWALGIYQEVVVPERLVYRQGPADSHGNPVPITDLGMSAEFPSELLHTVTFTEQQGRTTVTLRVALPGDFPERSAMEEGWHEMFAHLAELLPRA